MEMKEIQEMAERIADLTDELFTKVVEVESKNEKLKEQLKRTEALLLSCSRELAVHRKD